jgi:hypothetical protein
MHYTTRKFWRCYEDLPKSVQEVADQCYQLELFLMMVFIRPR